MYLNEVSKEGIKLVHIEPSEFKNYLGSPYMAVIEYYNGTKMWIPCWETNYKEFLDRITEGENLIIIENPKI